MRLISGEQEIKAMLNVVAEMRAQQQLLELDKRAMIDKVLTPEIKEQLDGIEAEFAIKKEHWHMLIQMLLAIIFKDVDGSDQY